MGSGDHGAHTDAAGEARHAPGPRERRAWLAAIAPLERILRPRFFGPGGSESFTFETSRPLMLVGNHQLLALDTPFLIAELWRRDVPVRPLGDDFLFALSPLARALRHLGVVAASFEAADALLAQGQCVLVYPGGAREASKIAPHSLQLDWWDRLGFARLALHRRATIVTIAAVGIDDNARILLDRRHYLHGAMGAAVERLGVRQDMLPPLFVFRHLPRLCFKFGEPIETRALFAHDPETAARRLRADVARAIEADLAWLDRRCGG